MLDTSVIGHEFPGFTADVKKGGALQFVVTRNTYANQLGELVARSTSNLVHRNPQD